MHDVEHDDLLGRAFDRRLIARLAAVARPHARLIAGTTALFPLIAGVELLQPYLLKVAIDEHILTGDWPGLTGVAGLFLAVLVTLAALRAVESYLMQLTGLRVMHDLRALLFRHLLRLEAAFFDRTPVGRLMTRVLNDAEAVSEAFTAGLFAVMGDVVTLAGVVAVMLWMDWRLALVTFSLIPVLGTVAGWFRVHARDAYREVRRRLARLNGFLHESLQGMTVIQLFARERHETEAFRRLNRDYRRAMFGSTVWEASLYATVEALGSAALALLIWYSAGRIAAETLTFGTLVAFIQYTNRFFLPIRDLGAKYTVMQAAMASSERIFGLLDRAPAIVAPAVPRAPQRRAGDTAAAFQSVWFAYDGEDWVLRDCTFTVASGEHVAIVGATGEGKTTCARLLNRAYDVGRGCVLVDGVDVREWDLPRLRRHVGVVFQDTMLFTGSVEANVRLGADGRVSRADLERAVDAANCRRVIDALPSGWAEELSERGANLSHGQRQLLAIARALVYNPPVLVLDEATSSVDAESEALIRQAMARLAEGRTTITIAHRLSTVQHADRILVLHRGRVHEEGRHAELLRRGALYARLWELSVRPRSA
ncbi:MAG TPA: ABC transporter ATP-binding protein [Methylomirabilota bacterium]|nr:ABC transporter ATP-binding protein [Methylomirabilota bacterium]